MTTMFPTKISKLEASEDPPAAAANTFIAVPPALNCFLYCSATSDGRLYLVVGQYRKQLSAGGTAMNVLAAAAGGSSDASNFEILVGNMVVIEFDATNKMTGYDLISKRKTSVLLPAGAGFWNTAFLGYYINSMGSFDYAFTSSDKKSDRYSVVYIDANRKEEKGATKSDLMVGVIQIDGGER